MNEDDILLDIHTMEKSNKSIPVKGGQEMHVSTLRAFIHLYSLLGFLIVTINSSTCMSS